MLECLAMKKAAIIIGLLLPFSVSALEYRNLSLLYTDAPFTPAESAGISLLTSLDAIEGYPDGTYQPNRTLNRAEFLKIVLTSYPDVRVSQSDAANCFPDVSKDDWFSNYVCLAKKRGMVSGYPDGAFKPDRPVNYAEALKILSELYNYVAYSAPDEEWYAGYVRAAEFNKTALPSSIKYDRNLTRGQMARLAAAFRAHEEGELEYYRLSEKSFDLVIARQIADEKQEEYASSSSSSSAVSTSSSASSESSTSSVVSQHYTFPATNHFLVLGTRDVIGSGQFHPRNENVIIENVTVEFRNEPKNIRALYLVDSDGTHILELQHDTFDPEDKTWKSVPSDEEYILTHDGAELGIEALIKDEDAGFSEELIELRWISMNVRAVQDDDQYQLIAEQPSYPAHQTAMGRITSVENNSPPILDLGDGDQVLLNEFRIAGEHLADGHVRVQHLTFTIAEQDGVMLSNFSLGAAHSIVQQPCSVEAGVRINCLDIPASIGLIEHGEIIVQLRGDMTIDETATSPRLRITIKDPGTVSTSIQPGTLGHLRWNDGSAAFKWVELPEPVAEGSVWK